MTPTFHRRQLLRLLAVALATSGLGIQAFAHGPDDERDGLRRGKLFMSTNAPTGNAVNVYARAANGPATLIASVATHGIGTGAALGSQGAVTLSGNGRYLFVVNAGSNSVSTFRLGRSGLELASTVSSGGQRPISVTESDGLVYVLNAPAAGAGNSVVGFRNEGGTLKPLADGTRTLADGSAPAQVSFDADGEVLVVSEKSANQLVTWRVNGNGTLANAGAVTPSPGAVPFGFAVSSRNVLVVSEAATSSASSYRIGGRHEPALQLVSPAVANGQLAACWVAITPDGRFAYTSNAASNNISSYAIDRKGALTLLQAQAGVTSNNGALDIAATPDGTQLHVFAQRAPQQIVSFTIGGDGSLTRIGALNVSAGAGLAAN